MLLRDLWTLTLYVVLICPAGLFTYHKGSGYYWFSNSPTEDSYNEYHLVGLVSSSHSTHRLYITKILSNSKPCALLWFTYFIISLCCPNWHSMHNGPWQIVLTQLMGLAIYNSTILDIRFPPCCYKMLLFSSCPDNKLTTANRASKRLEACGQDALSSSDSSLELTLHDLTEVMPVSDRIWFRSINRFSHLISE